MNRKIILLFGLLLASLGAPAQDRIETGAEQTDRYLPLLEGRRVGIMTNHTGTVGRTHLVDTLRSLGVDIRVVFAPEHGFRGQADAGESVASYRDRKTGIDVVSVYGSTKRPPDSVMQRLDVLLFDIQDVGLRYYTYLSSMHYLMEACAANGKRLIVLDRPNPNGFYVDGPVLEAKHRSFVGMHPIPVVHGMTLGELARMIDGEGWLRDGLRCKLTVIPCRGYTHRSRYRLPTARLLTCPTCGPSTYIRRFAFSRARRSAWAEERISRFRHTDTRSCRAISRLRRAATWEPRIRRSKTGSATASICGPPRPTSGYGRGE